MARLALSLWIFSLTISVYVSPAPLRSDLKTATRYLKRYRYLPNDTETPREVVLSALETFQQSNDLEETGELDDATIQRMRNPTCREIESSVPNSNSGRRRERRYTLAQGVAWTKRVITFHVVNSPPTMTLPAVQDVFRRAFNDWQNVCGLTFVAYESFDADIQIYFLRGSHGDRQSFDGPGGLLAHANTPYNNGLGQHGDIHLDYEENWVIARGGKNLYQVALHEIGHTLALGHSVPNTVMHALYPPTYNPNFRLQLDDIMAVQFLYGPNNNPTENMRDPDTETEDDTCVEAVDAVTSLGNGSVFAFIGKEVHYLADRRGEDDFPTLATGFPKTLTETFGDALASVDQVDAALYWSLFNKLYIFVGSIYYRYSIPSSPVAMFPMTPDSGYPKQISDQWTDVPNDIDAATVAHDNSVFIFKNGTVYNFGLNVDRYSVLPGFPRPLRSSNTPFNSLFYVNIQAAMTWSDGNYYILNDDNYYKMRSESETPLPGYPRSLSQDWFGCDILQNRT